MLNVWRPPRFEDEERTRAARILNVIIWLLVPGTLFASVSSMLTAPRAGWLYVSFAVLVGLLLVAARLMHRGHVHLASYVALTGVLAAVTESVALDGLTSPAVASFLALQIMSGAVLGTRGVAFATLGSLVAVGLFLALEQVGLWRPQTSALDSTARALTYMLQFAIVGAMLWLIEEERRRNRAFAKRHAEELAQANAVLAQRGEEQAALADVGHQALASGDLELLRFTTERVGEVLSADACAVFDTLQSKPVATWPPDEETPLEVIREKLYAAGVINGPVMLPATGSATVSAVAFDPQGAQAWLLVVWNEQGLARTESQFYFLTSVANVLTEALRRRRAEAQLLHSQKLESVGRLAGGIAHDFNNMITAISGNAALLMASEGASKLELQEILTATDRAAALTRQLLLFSRKEPARTRIVPLGATVVGVEGMLRRLLSDRVQLTIEVRREAYVWADGNQLEQVVLNLVVNARDAMPLGGRIWVDVGDEGDRAVLSVTDEGTGIPESVRSQIFEPFFTTKPAGLGTGLGLSVVHGIVQRAGGHIRVESAVPQGSTFRVTLPLASTEEVHAAGLQSS